MIEPLSAEKIHSEILPKLKGGTSFIDALCEYARENELEIEAVAEVVKRSVVLVALIEKEAAALRLVKTKSHSGKTLDAFF